MTEMMLSPDCRDGNHQKCNGDAWDLEADGITDCRCGCHDEPEAMRQDIEHTGRHVAEIYIPPFTNEQYDAGRKYGDNL